MGISAAGLAALASYGAYRSLKKPKNTNSINNNSIRTNNTINTITPAKQKIDNAKENKANNVTSKKRNIRIVKSSKNAGGKFITPKAIERKRIKEDKANNIPPLTNKNANIYKAAEEQINELVNKQNQKIKKHKADIGRTLNADVIKRREAERDQERADLDLLHNVHDKVSHNTRLRDKLYMNNMLDKFKRGLITEDEYYDSLDDMISRKYDITKGRILYRGVKKGRGHVYDKYVKDYEPLTKEEVKRRYKAQGAELDAKRKRDAIDSAVQKKMDNDSNFVFNSAEDYIDNLLNTFYEAYYYDLITDNEYEAFVESVYEADDLDEISDIETVFESYIE